VKSVVKLLPENGAAYEKSGVCRSSNSIFLDLKRKERGSPITLRFYKECLGHYAKDGKWPPTKENILDFLDHFVDGIHHKPRTPESVNYSYAFYFRALRAFFCFLISAEVIERSPMQGWKLRRPLDNCGSKKRRGSRRGGETKVAKNQN
jgi:hypothetical protein